ncbi:MAG: hypothetical protein ABIH99_05390 [Candidatus Micrarchaeota archaeon]
MQKMKGREGSVHAGGLDKTARSSLFFRAPKHEPIIRVPKFAVSAFVLFFAFLNFGCASVNKQTFYERTFAQIPKGSVMLSAENLKNEYANWVNGIDEKLKAQKIGYWFWENWEGRSVCISEKLEDNYALVFVFEKGVIEKFGRIEMRASDKGFGHPNTLLRNNGFFFIADNFSSIYAWVGEKWRIVGLEEVVARTGEVKKPKLKIVRMGEFGREFLVLECKEWKEKAVFDMDLNFLGNVPNVKGPSSYLLQ